MRRVFVVVFLFLASCKGDNSPGPQGSFGSDGTMLSGTWELVRIVNAFSQTDFSKDEIRDTQLITINSGTGTFTHQLNSHTPEISSLQIGEQGGKPALILVDEAMYHWYSFEEWRGSKHLVLYQKCPLGAVLADGSYYYYMKR